MAGVVTFAIRHNNKILCRRHYTGSVSRFRDMKVLEGEAETLARLFPEVPATQTENNLLYPEAYGLIVADLDNKVIFNLQDTVDLEVFPVSAIHMDMDHIVLTDRNEERITEVFRRAFEKHAIRRCRVWVKKTNQLETQDIPREMMNLSSLLEFAFKTCEIKYVKGKALDEELRDYLFEPPGWEIINLQFSQEGFKVAKMIMEKAGFTFNAEEMAGWDQAIAQWETQTEPLPDPEDEPETPAAVAVEPETGFEPEDELIQDDSFTIEDIQVETDLSDKED